MVLKLGANTGEPRVLRDVPVLDEEVPGGVYVGHPFAPLPSVVHAVGGAEFEPCPADDKGDRFKAGAG
jgi:hypothetical protein